MKSWNEKLELLHSLPKVVPPVSIRLPEGVTDDGLAHVVGLSRLQTLAILGNNVTDAGLQHLKAVNSLKRLIIWSDKVTAPGVKDLQQALPDCEITLSR